MEIRALTETNEFQDCVALQARVWGFDDIDTVPTNLISAYCDKVSPWGIVLGAFEESRMVGFILCLPTSNSEIYWLHMIGVVPESQSSDNKYGWQLMCELIRIAKERSIKTIVWTYDPLESVNANLYISKMGAVCRTYVEDYYSFRGSRTHSGVPADRFKAELFLDSQIKEGLLAKTGMDAKKVSIPDNFQEIKRTNLDEANRWRVRTRKDFQHLINERKYIITDFEYNKDTRTAEYVLKGTSL